MIAVFLTLFAAYVALTVMANRRRQDPIRHRGKRRVGLGIHLPMFLLAAYYAAGGSVFSRDLVSPLAIAAGLVVGHLVFGLSLLATDRNPAGNLRHFLALKPLWCFLVESPVLIGHFILVSIGEEMIYRVAAQSMLVESLPGSPIYAALAIASVAAAFSLTHWHFLRNRVARSAEFIGFALLLGALYYWTHSLIFVIVVHTVRNLECAYLEYVEKLAECGEKNKALAAVERAYMRPLEYT